MKGGLTPNELREWLEEIMRTDGNYQREDWELLFESAIEVVQTDLGYKKSSVSAMEMDPVTTTEPKF